MRIISGKNRGIKLAHIGVGDLSNHLRPTTDRIRENIFNLLSNGLLDLSFKDVRVLDVFAGSGALGLEAFSRGASWVTFIEKNKVSIEIIKKNSLLCKASECSEIQQEDATKIKKNNHKTFDLIFLDPPYGTRLGEKALLRMYQENWISNNATIVFENNSEVLLQNFITLDSRKYGKTIINILTPVNK